LRSVGGPIEQFEPIFGEVVQGQSPDPLYDQVGNIQLSRIMGGDVRLDPGAFDIGVGDSWERALASVREAGGVPYAIPAGASDHPLGGLGFARWAREVAVSYRPWAPGRPPTSRGGRGAHESWSTGAKMLQSPFFIVKWDN